MSVEKEKIPEDVCEFCGGSGTIDITSTWKETTIWCPKCNKEKFDSAREYYLKQTGFDLAKYLNL